MAAGYSDAEQKINLSVLQQKDPYITGIADSASQVAAYSFNAALNEWEKTNIEGTLFVYTRSAFPLNGFMIINRLHLNDLIEPINKNLEFQLQDPFLLYRNSQSSIYGIWFYDRDECARIGQLMNSLVQVATDTHNQEIGRQRRASESDSTAERPAVPMEVPLSSLSPQKNNVDIIQMLSKAQDEYDKSKTQPSTEGRAGKDADQLGNSAAVAGAASCSSPPKQANGASPVIKHYAAYNGMVPGQALPGLTDQQQNAPTHINLETLFRKASLQNGKSMNEQKIANATAKSAFHVQPPVLPPNQTTPTVEEIERAQRESNAGNVSLGVVGNSRSGTTSDLSTSRGHRHLDFYGQQFQNNPQAPESPNTALRRTLKIIPPSSSAAGRPSSVVAREAVGHPPKPSDLNRGFVTSKSQSTVVQSLFSQQSGRVSGQGCPPRINSPNANIGLPPYCLSMQLNQVPGHAVVSDWLSKNDPAAPHKPTLSCSITPHIDAPKYVQPSSVQQRIQPWIGPEDLPVLTAPEIKQPICPPVATGPSAVAEIFARQSSISDGLTKPEAFLSNFVKGGDLLTGTTLLSPMAFQNHGISSKLPKGNSNASIASAAQGGQETSSTLKTGNPTAVKEQTSSIGSGNSECEPLPLTPLNKEQLRQALITLLMTDNGFITTIHEAYTASLNKESMGRNASH